MTNHDALFTTLFTQPPGRYGLSAFGQTHAVILTGCPLFHELGYNLFLNGGGEAKRSLYAETPLPPLHKTDDARVVWFCLPEARVKLALRLYFYAQLVRADTTDILDADGDFTEVACLNEARHWEDAEQLACDFMVSHMRPNSGALPTYEADQHVPAEHGLGNLGAPHVSEDA